MSIYVACGKQHTSSFFSPLLAELHDDGRRACSVVAKKEASGLSHVLASAYTYCPMAWNLHRHPWLRVEHRPNENTEADPSISTD